MIVRKSLEELAEFLETARDRMDFRNPKIQMIEVGQYRVSGSKGTYLVVCGRTEYGHFFVACNCLAGLHGKACNHSLKCFETHVAVMIEVKKEGKL